MTTLKRVLPFAHFLLQSCVKSGDTTIDATVGNGNDTVFLAKLVGENGKVFGFDIQEQAIERTRERLDKEKLSERVGLLLHSHADVASVIPEEHLHKISAAIFNLGYLPGGDKHIVTTPQTTIRAIQQLLTVMTVGGLIVLVVYHGHPEGEIERDELLHFVSTLDQKQAHVLKYQFINQINNAPFIIAIEKRQ